MWPGQEGDWIFNTKEPLLTVTRFLGGRDGEARVAVCKEF